MELIRLYAIAGCWTSIFTIAAFLARDTHRIRTGNISGIVQASIFIAVIWPLWIAAVIYHFARK